MNEPDYAFDAPALFASLRDDDGIDPTATPLQWRFGIEGTLDRLEFAVGSFFEAIAGTLDCDEDNLRGEIYQSEDPSEQNALFVAAYTGTMTETQLHQVHEALDGASVAAGLSYGGVDVDAEGDSDDGPSHDDAIKWVDEVIVQTSDWPLSDLDAVADRMRSNHLEALRAAGLEAADWMPTAAARFNPPAMRSHEEICQRLMAAMITTAWVYAPSEVVSTEQVKRYLTENRLSKQHFSQREQEWMKMKRAQAAQQGDKAGWITENIWSLAWLIGGAPIPTFHNEPVSAEIMNPIRLDLLGNLDKNVDQLVAETRLQPPERVIAEEDLLYCAHNAIRSIALDDPDEIASMGYVQERRQSLTWALSPDVAWDDTDVST